ncbi:MAG: hypothetical protein HC880_20630, partial [Bacteroidia bacterium]|nr:hypothetical protein [Bacteroidia bacterium]
MSLKISQDILWKGIIEDLFVHFLHYFFPDFARNEVNFRKKFVFLDKELEQVRLEIAQKKRTVDKLVQVFTKAGTPQWCLIHIEVQGYRDAEFAERMFDYFIRIREKHKQNITVLVIYTDESPSFHPRQYEQRFLGTELTFRFNTFKLRDKKPEDLEVPNNPFSLVMLTAYHGLRKKNQADPVQMKWKFRLTKQLMESGYEAQDLRKIFYFIQNYVSFDDPANKAEYEKQLSTILPNTKRKSMGIEEAILAEVKEQGVQEGIQLG